MKVYVDLAVPGHVDVDCAMTFACDQWRFVVPSRQWTKVPAYARKMVAEYSERSPAVIQIRRSALDLARKMFGHD